MWKTLGHEKSIDIISRGIDSGRLSHAYLITGVEGIGKTTLAVDIACVVNCPNQSSENNACGLCSQCTRILKRNHTDLFVYDLEPTSDDIQFVSSVVTMEQLREDFLKQIYRKPFEGMKRVFIINSVDRMRAEQSNLLLKTLEEPPEDAIIILLAENVEAVIETIVSRCQVLNLKHVELEVVRNYLKQFGDLETEDLENIARLARGRIGWAHQSATDPEFFNETLSSLDKIGNLAFANLEERFVYAKELASRFRKDRRIGYNDIDNLLTWWRDLLMVCSDQDGYVINLLHMEKFRKISLHLTSLQVANSIFEIREAFKSLHKNVSPSLVYDNLMLKLPTVPD